MPWWGGRRSCALPRRVEALALRQDYSSVQQKIGGAGGETTAAVVISSTAHPSHWVSCALQSLDTYVFTRRWSNHSEQHGLASGKKISLEVVIAALKSDSMTANVESGVKSENTPFPCLTTILSECPQTPEAYNCHQGSAWHDGLNLALPSKVLEPQSAKLTNHHRAKSVGAQHR